MHENAFNTKCYRMLNHLEQLLLETAIYSFFGEVSDKSISVVTISGLHSQEVKKADKQSIGVQTSSAQLNNFLHSYIYCKEILRIETI